MTRYSGRVAYYALGAVAIAVYFLLSGRTQAIGYEVIGLYAVFAVLVGGRRNFKNGGRLAWELFAAGLALEVAADATYTVYDYLGHTVPTPSVADVLYLAGYPLLAAGVFVLLRELGARMSRAVALDAVIAFVAVSTLQWVFVLASLLHVHVSTGAKLVDLAYPCADVLLVGAILQLLVVPTPRSGTYRLLTVAVALWFIGDEIYLLRPNAYSAGSWLDAVWLGAYVVWGGAAVQPAGAGLPAQDAAEPRLTRMRAIVLGIALLAVPIAIGYEAERHGHPAHMLAAAIGMGVIAVLVLVRLADLLHAEIGALNAETALSTASLLLKVAFFLVVGVVLYMFWRDVARHEIGMWAERQMRVFYAAVGLLIVDAGWWIVRAPSGRNALISMVVAAIGAYVAFTTWREQKRYS